MSQQDRNPKPIVAWNWMQVASQATEIGFSVAIPLIIFVLGGLFLDTQLQTRPLFTLVGTLTGMFVSGFSFVRTMTKLLHLSKAERTPRRTRTIQDSPTAFVGMIDEDRTVDERLRTEYTEVDHTDPRLRTYQPGEAPLPDITEEEYDPFQLPKSKSSHENVANKDH